MRASMLQLGPYSAWVTIAGTPREVYAAGSDDAGSSASCWIASEQGEAFSVNWHNASRHVALEAVISIDGVTCNRHVMLDGYNYPEKPDAFGISYARTSDYTRRDFVFSAIQVTDDDAYLYTLGETFNFGIIQLQLWRLRVNNVLSQQPLVHQYGGQVLESQVLHERSKKAGAHHVKFGEEYPSARPIIDRVDGQRMDPDPLLTFTFRYRPLGMLMANGIIPRPIPTVAYPDSPPLQYKGSPDFSLPRLDALDRRAGHGDRLNMKQEEGSGSTLEEIRNLEERLRTLRSTIPTNGTQSSSKAPQSSSESQGLSPLAARREKRRQMGKNLKMEDRSAAYYMRESPPREVIDLT